MARTKHDPNGIAVLSGKTYIKDCPQVVKDYLQSIGHRRAMIRDAVVWVRREKNKVVAAGANAEAVALPVVESSPVQAICSEMVTDR